MNLPSEQIEYPKTINDIAQRAAWLDVFSAQRKIIVQGIIDGLPLSERAKRLRIAEASLPDVALEDLPHLDVIAGLLDDKMIEMLEVIQKRAKRPLSQTRLPADLEPNPEWDSLNHDTCRLERRWLFVGGMQEILFHYRDSARVLILDEIKKLLSQLSTSMAKTLAVLDQLDSHLVVSLVVSDLDRALVNKFRELTPEINTLYKNALGQTRDTGLQALLENSLNRYRIQFLATTAQLCLKIYGNVSIYHLRELWLLKSMYPLLQPATDPEGFIKNLADDEHKALQRSIDGSLNRLCKQAERDSLAIWPILRLYRYNPKFGRRLTKPPKDDDTEGFASIQPPSDGYGASIIRGI
jgi:hypothetical protein